MADGLFFVVKFDATDFDRLAIPVLTLGSITPPLFQLAQVLLGHISGTVFTGEA
jgi:hypothetical protein